MAFDVQTLPVTIYVSVCRGSMPRYLFPDLSCTDFYGDDLVHASHDCVPRGAKEELDRVIGRSRMPTLKDRESLPYIRATVRELFRWRAVAPIGELLPNMNCSIYCIHREIGEAGVPRYTMEVGFSHCLLQTFWT